MAKGPGKAAQYIYGVVRTAPARPKSKAKGVFGRPVRVISSKGLGAITSDAPEGALEAGRDELMAHAHVLEKAFERGTVLPMRFGVVMPDEPAVRAGLLDAHRDELEAQLDEMNGKVEINLKGMYEEDQILREIVETNADIAALRNSVFGQPEEATYYERIRLGELVAEELSVRRDEDERQIAGRLAPRVVAVEVGDPVHERMAVNASFLLEREQLHAFDEELDAIASEQNGRIRFKYTGPLPPHSFVELSLGA